MKRRAFFAAAAALAAPFGVPGERAASPFASGDATDVLRWVHAGPVDFAAIRLQLRTAFQLFKAGYRSADGITWRKTLPALDDEADVIVVRLSGERGEIVVEFRSPGGQRT